MTELAFDKFIEQVENILDGEKQSVKMTRQLRDAFLFYTARHVREINGKTVKHEKDIRTLKIVVGILAIVVFAIFFNLINDL